MGNMSSFLKMVVVRNAQIILRFQTMENNALKSPVDQEKDYPNLELASAVSLMKEHKVFILVDQMIVIQDLK